MQNYILILLAILMVIIIVIGFMGYRHVTRLTTTVNQNTSNLSGLKSHLQTVVTPHLQEPQYNNQQWIPPQNVVQNIDLDDNGEMSDPQFDEEDNRPQYYVQDFSQNENNTTQDIDIDNYQYDQEQENDYVDNENIENNVDQNDVQETIKTNEQDLGSKSEEEGEESRSVEHLEVDENNSEEQVTISSFNASDIGLDTESEQKKKILELNENLENKKTEKKSRRAPNENARDYNVGFKIQSSNNNRWYVVYETNIGHKRWKLTTPPENMEEYEKLNERRVMNQSQSETSTQSKPQYTV